METALKQNYLFTNKQLFKLIIPLVLEQFLTFLVGMADTIMVSSVGENAVSAVSLIDTVNVLIINIIVAFATGGAVVAGQYIGSKKTDQACKSADQLFVFLTLLSLVITAVMYLLNGFILDVVFGTITPEVRKDAFSYFMIVTSSMPFIAIYSAGASLFRAMGNSSTSMKVSIIMNGINVGGNALLIYGFGMGVEGVAIPTVVSRVVAAAIMVALISKPDLPVHLSRPFRYKYNGNMIKKMLYIGVPNSVENSMFQLGKILVLSLISSFGTVAIAANAVGNNIALIQCLPGMAMSYAMSAVISQCVGANDYVQVRYYIKKLVFICYAMMIVLNIVMYPMLDMLIGLYDLSAETFVITKEILVLHGFHCCLTWSVAFNVPHAFRACADVKYTLWVSMISMWVVRI
ncbi:MAG: MATE family efflux transporter, partial [Firmicutes bacterium]|nr:MATE family efflux transporter [Bacillota bacterium]